jgi:signal transduction histidine kinase
MPYPRSEAERARDTLRLGILAFRWGALAWMISLAVTTRDPFRRPELAWASLGATIAWTIWLTVRLRDETRGRHSFDLALAVALFVVSGLVVGERQVLGGRPFFATAYPVAAVLSWGAAFGLAGGLFAGAVLGGALAVSRTLNGVPFELLTAAQIAEMVNGAMAYLLAGGAVGIVKRLLDRTADQFRDVNEAAVRERERAARLAERESLAREIHDSVLQALALIHKRGRELGERDAVSGGEIRALANLARDQEAVLRGLILREPEQPPADRASLRDALEGTARDLHGIPVQVTAIGPIWLARHTVEELVGAVREALVNVARHANATRAAVFVEEGDGDIVVTVRDDGDGFVFEEERLRAEGKAGVLKSMKGRAEALGGAMRVETAPGRGTEVEFRIPGEGR